MTTTLEPREHADRVLGEAVHPYAIDRLFELWPEARVKVIHAPAGMRPRFTIVKLTEGEGDEADQVAATATCSGLDQFNRKRGIRIAFGRALKEIPRHG